MSKGVVYKANHLTLRPAVSLIAFAALAGAQVVIDGVPSEPFWSRAAAARLAPVARGIPAGEGGEVRSAIAAGSLYVALR
ncbi:MAG: hypothetical protein HYR60_03085, partial [Acidobacteria bacterium]|nr:hypothetical protein [Acidobacteriota bacterium]